jgi:hypothetical protein
MALEALLGTSRFRSAKLHCLSVLAETVYNPVDNLRVSLKVKAFGWGKLST